jgi:hypothetical protein
MYESLQPSRRMKPTIFIPSSILTPLILAGSLAMSSGCASHEPAAPANDEVESGRIITGDTGAEITLAPGEIAEVPSVNLRLRFNRLVGDSRCPNDPAIQCVWGGSVVVELQAGPIVGRQFLELKRLESLAGKDTATVAGQLVRFVRVTPEKRSTAEIPSSNYRIVLQVGAMK